MPWTMAFLSRGRRLFRLNVYLFFLFFGEALRALAPFLFRGETGMDGVCRGEIGISEMEKAELSQMALTLLGKKKEGNCSQL